MATLQMLINLFPAETGGIQALAALLLAVTALGVGSMVAVICRRAARRRAATGLARQRGLTERSACFFAATFEHERAGVAESLLTAPDLLCRRLVLEIARQRGAEAALHFAADAAQLLDELGLREPAFEGAPLPCEPLLLTDPAWPANPGVLVFVASADEKNLVAVSRSPCPWPLSHSLVAAPQPLPGGGPMELQAPPAGDRRVTNSNGGAGGVGAAHRAGSAANAGNVSCAGVAGSSASRPAFGVALLLRPMPPQHEWVLTHALVETITNRRATVRVPCRIETVALPDSGDPLLLRQRLQREESVPLQELRRSRAWSQRLSVTLTDLSADGARLVLDQPLGRHQRLHLLFTGPDESLLALPLAEVVDVRRDEAGRTIAGVRFIGVRMKERLRLADHVRALAAPAGANAHKLPRGPGRQRGPGL